jgi:hypothetical protein
MRIAGIPEEIEPVTFSALKPGMTVWVTECGWCGGKHRCFLLKRVSAVFAQEPSGKQSYCPGFVVLPRPKCMTIGQDSLLNDSGDGGVYRVVDVEFEAEQALIARLRQVTV